MIHIGTSGWNYRHWKGRFYPEGMPQKKWLEYFIEHFRTVELNSSFYKMPERKTFETWRLNVPEKFIFSVKVYRYITHQKKLSDPGDVLNTFIYNAEALQEKLGILLFQLPPGFKFNPEKLSEFISLLRAGKKYTFEFRNPSWWNDETYKILEENKCSFCIFQIAGRITPKVTTANYIYIRLHGPTNKPYQGSYSNETLAEWAELISGWKKQRKSVYCYFDNDDNAYAVYNAAKLKQLLNL